MTPPRRVFLVEERDNPSTAYFLLPAVSGQGIPVTRVGFAAVPEAADLDGALVILVRYAATPWVRAVAANRRRLAGLVFFMDDDVLDPATFAGLPWHYRFKLWRLAARRAGWLRDQGAALWVSTPVLAAKYAAWPPRLLLPAALDDPAGPGTDARCVFYHGTASHWNDIRWLVPVARELLTADAHLRFEIVGGRDVAALYGALPGATVVQPLPWPAYRRFAVSGARHVGLVPQTAIPFNRTRSYTKFFDITRAGAVGVYAAGSACAAVVTSGRDGLVAPMEHGAWVAAIRELLGDEVRRLAMLEAARETAGRLDAEARRRMDALLRDALENL